ncbi:transposase family protein [Streptomyces sp. NPDC002734]|uniref:transposase family protein n=1 Tax=Streptomyces sp. NPDC002734 TaxID=3154426 RepID=UPI00331CB9D7
MEHSLTRPAYDTGATSRSITARAAPEVGAVHTAGAEGRAVRGDPSRHWTDSKNIWPRSWRTYGAERDERAVAERVLERASEQLADERASARPTPGQGGWAAGRDADPRQGGEVVLSDGTLIATQPCTGKADRWDCSGKHHHHGLRFLAPTDERGRLIWTIRRRPDRTHDNTAARQDHVMAHLRAATLGASADLGYRGLDNDVLDPVIVTGFHAGRTHKLTPARRPPSAPSPSDATLAFTRGAGAVTAHSSRGPGVFLTGLFILMGSLGDRIGRRRLVLAGAAAFGGRRSRLCGAWAPQSGPPGMIFHIRVATCRLRRSSTFVRSWPPISRMRWRR